MILAVTPAGRARTGILGERYAFGGVHSDIYVLGGHEQFEGTGLGDALTLAGEDLEAASAAFKVV